jgi:murein DD-endopeptidase MepM/ murein hydrolase activator NlpD
MSVSLDDEVLPITPADVASPFLLQTSARMPSLFQGVFYPTQGDAAQLGLAGEFRGLYGDGGSPTWQPDWSNYQANRSGHTHWGVDIYGPVGYPVVAVVDGELSFRNQPGGLGLYAVLTIVVQGMSYEFHYGHLQGPNGAARSVPGRGV